MLSLRMALPSMPMVAALSANHLAAILFPPTLRRLYIARDADPAGDAATDSLLARAHSAGIEAIVAVAAARRLQRGPARSRHRRALCSVARPARTGGRGALHVVDWPDG